MNKEERDEFLAKSINEAIIDVRKSRIREAGAREKVYFTVITGSLVLSVSFLTVFQKDFFEGISLLIISWSLLTVAIVCKLIAYITVDKHFGVHENRIREWRDEWIKTGSFDKNNIPKEKNKWTIITTTINYISYFATIVGLILLVIFGIENIKSMVDNTNIDSSEKQAECTTSENLEDCVANLEQDTEGDIENTDSE